YHPETQKTPKEEKLRQWYELMLKKASNEGIVVGRNNFYDQFFVPKREENIKITAACLPYFDGAFWSGNAEALNALVHASLRHASRCGVRYAGGCGTCKQAWLESDQSHVDCKQEKEGDKEDQGVIRSVKGNHDIERLKLSPLPYSGYEYSTIDTVEQQKSNKEIARVLIAFTVGNSV
nr:probable histone acetyltransferase HAC-like 1 isoform X1 [Tanacetum cinerariifolium]